MLPSHVEYRGFTQRDGARAYTLLVREGSGEAHEFTVSIRDEAFLSRRVRYQDGPEICFSKLQREMIASGASLPELSHDITDAELEEFRVSHTPKPPKRRPRPPVAT